VFAGFLFQVWFFNRYGLPISFALIALSILVTSLLLLQIIVGEEAFQDYLNPILAVTGCVVLGLAVFVDAKDPLRRNGWAECAFWLYVVGAPMLIHPTVSAVDYAYGVVIPLILIAVLVSLIIDRRSLIISSLIYLAYLVSAVFEVAELDASIAFVTACFTVGAVVLGLGFGWTAARRQIMGLLDPFPWRRYLPPC